MIPRLKCLCSWGSEYGRKSYFCLSNFIFILGHLTVITQTFTLQYQIFRGCQTHRPKSNQKFPRYNMKCSGKHDTIWNIPHSITFFPLHFMLFRGKSISFGAMYGRVHHRFLFVFAEMVEPNKWDWWTKSKVFQSRDTGLCFALTLWLRRFCLSVCQEPGQVVAGWWPCTSARARRSTSPAQPAPSPSSGQTLAGEIRYWTL